MKSIRVSSLLALLAIDATTTIMSVSSYTFDPLNNSWKPSGRRTSNRSHHSSSSASSYSYAPAEPTPAVGVEFTYNEEDIVRHHYTAWGVGSNGDENNNDPAFVPKQTIVEIQYNKRTGEVSLLDEDGVVTPEEYKRLIKAVKYSEEGDDDVVKGTTASEQRLQSQEREEDVAVGTTLYVDPEDLDPTDIIDTEGLELSADDSPPIATASQQEVDSNHYPQQLQDYPEPSTQYHHSEAVSTTTTTETINTISIPQPTTDNSYPVTAQSAQYRHYQYSQQPMQTASVVAEPTAEQYYQQQMQTSTVVAEPAAEQYYQQQAAHQYPHAEYYQTSVTEQPSSSTSEETMEETYFNDEAYRSSRGFGFAHRRGFFTGPEN
jgi:hypothetical protein